MFQIIFIFMVQMPEYNSRMIVKVKMIMLFIMLASSAAWATHIVGGEFEFVHMKDYTYNLSMNLYFDDVNGNPLIKEQDLSVLVYIYRKRDNTVVNTITLPRISITPVNYTNIACAIGSLKTSKLIYSADINLSPFLYDDPEGYYVVWERCCRNGTITNIVDPGNTGQTFYLEFPAIVKNGEPFINSSPILFPPLSDYACINQPYYVDFNGTDPDGDSVTYRLVTPLNSSDLLGGPNGIPNALPTPSPAPHGLVNWSEGISISNIIPGGPSLEVNATGLLTVTPSQTGLYVFSVVAEEYRDAKKIGSVRRDFQMLVIDCPAPGVAPEVLVKVPGIEGYYSESKTITFSKDEPRCLEMLVMDKDGQENIRLKAIPVNFAGEVGEIFSISQGFLNNSDDTLSFEVCFPQCPYLEKGPFIIDLIAMDDACSLPLADTIRITVFMETQDNEPPSFTSPSARALSANVAIGSTYNLPLEARDGDNDLMVLDVIAEGFTLAEYGMQVTENLSIAGKLEHHFQFTADCEKYDFAARSNFPIAFIVNDIGACDASSADTLYLNLNIIFPPNNAPVVSIPSVQDINITARIGETLDFMVFSQDADNDFITLDAAGEGFSLEGMGAKFENKEGSGSLQSPFSWQLSCNVFDLSKKDRFIIYFFSEDKDKCKLSNADTFAIILQVLPPLNNKPIVSINDLSNPHITLRTGNTLDMEVIGYDQDNDNITLELIQVNERQVSLDFQFEPVSGRGLVRSRLIWAPECSLLEQNSVDNTFEFTFVVKDDKCINRKADTLKLEVVLEDVLANYEAVRIGNLITPKDEQYNQNFIALNLPEDNCYSKYIGVSIYNRNGKLVYQDNKRDFKWNGNQAPAGAYFYHIRYTQYEYKGWVHLVY